MTPGPASVPPPKETGALPSVGLDDSITILAVDRSLSGKYRIKGEGQAAESPGSEGICFQAPGTGALFPYVDGRIHMRARDGTIRCYDLRKRN